MITEVLEFENIKKYSFATEKRINRALEYKNFINRTENLFQKILKNKDDYIILDFKTTNKSIKEDNLIIEIGAIDLNGNKILDTLVYTNKKISPKQSAITGITNKDLIDKPKFEEIFPVIKKLKNKRIIVFNKQYIKNTLELYKIDNNFKYISIMDLYKKISLTKKDLSVAKIVSLLQIKGNSIHNSINDCYYMRDIIIELSKKLKDYTFSLN